MAILAMYSAKSGGLTLSEYLGQKVFAGTNGSTANPQPEDKEGFRAFLRRYTAGLPVEKLAGETRF